MIAHIITIVLASIVNRFRGGGYWADKIPVKALWIAAPLMGLLAYSLLMTPTLQTLYFVLSFIATYVVWAIMPWGRWFDLGRMFGIDIGRPYTKYELVVEDVTYNIMRMVSRFISDRNHLKWFDRIALYIRHFSMLTPGIVLLGLVTGKLILIPFIPVIALAFVLCYEIGWQLWDRHMTNAPITIAEHLVGILWGLSLIWLV